MIGRRSAGDIVIMQRIRPEGRVVGPLGPITPLLDCSRVSRSSAGLPYGYFVHIFVWELLEIINMHPPAKFKKNPMKS